jgi:NitT/TauT family transport system substrate-binding protein
MKKKILTLTLISMFCLSLFAGCSQTEQKAASKTPQSSNSNAQTVITVIAPKSPALIPILRMMESNCMGESVKINLQFYSDMEAMMTLASKGEYSVLIAPPYTAANLYNKGINVKLLNVFNWGGMYLSTTDPNCNSWKDLKGKELYVPSKGSVPDILTQYFLSQNGLTIGKNIEVVYSSHPEIAQLIASGTIRYAVDAQPFVSSNQKKVKGYQVISDFSEEWKQTQGKEYTMPGTCAIVNTEFLNKNESLISKFNEKLSDAVEWAIDHPSEAGALAHTHLNANAELIADAMPGFCFGYKSAADAKNDVNEYLNVLYKLKPESIGNKIPDDSFFYTAQ